MSLVHSASGLAEDRPLGRSSFDPKCGKALTLLRRAAGSNPARSTTNNIQRRETRVGPRALMKIHSTDSLLVSGRDPVPSQQQFKNWFRNRFTDWFQQRFQKTIPGSDCNYAILPK